MKEEEKKRVFYIDNLKWITILCVFVFHCLKLFVKNGSFLESQQESILAKYIMLFLNIWIMPMFFLLSGSSVFYSLKRRSSGIFIKDRSRRLLLPYLFWICLLYLPQIVLRFLKPDLFFQKFPEGSLVSLHNIPYDTSIFEHFGFHLWFVVFLFLYSIVSLPLIKNSNIIEKFFAIFSSGKYLFLLPLFLILINITLRPVFPSYGSWTDFLLWFLYFFSGYLLTGSNAISRLRKKSFFFTFSGLVTALPIILKYSEIYYQKDFSFKATIIRIIFTLSCYFFVFGLSGLASLYLDKKPIIKNIPEYLMPFYFIHQPWIIVVGVILLQWNLSVFFQFWLLLIFSLIFISLSYYVFIRKINFIRFLLGMNTLRTE